VQGDPPLVLPTLTSALWNTTARTLDAVRYFAAGLERRRPGVLDRLRVEAEDEIDTWDDLDVRLVPDSHPAIGSSGCSTAGMYQAGSTPPRLVVAASASRGRNNFTILHELAHHLQRTDPAWLMDVLGEMSPAEATRLEHRVCDEFASELLLPDAVWPADAPVTAGLLRDVHAESSASRAALIVRARRHMTPGQVAFLVSPDGEVLFGQARGDDLTPPPRGRPYDDPLIKRARHSPAGQVGGHIGFTYATGTRRDGLTATAAADDQQYVFVVAEQDSAYGRRAEWRLPTRDCACGAEYEVRDAGTCNHCGQPLCPECTTCPCADARTTTCTRCFLALSVAERAAGRTEHDDCG